MSFLSDAIDKRREEIKRIPEDLIWSGSYANHLQKDRNVQDVTNSIVEIGEKILVSCDKITGNVDTIEKELQK